MTNSHYSSFRDAWFRGVYDSLYPELYLYIHTFLSDEAEVQDIIQEVFLKLLENDRLEKVANIRAYLFSCVRNAVFDRLRKSRIQNLIRHEMILESLKENEEDNIFQVREDLFQITEEAIGNLPPVCRSVFMMAKRDNLSYREIADRLGISIKTVESQMGIAFKKIRQYVSIKEKAWK